MSSRPRLLDLFSGAGGSATGYDRAGFEVVGVDLRPQPRYPFEFVHLDALEAMAILLAGDCLVDTQDHGWHLSDFAAIHASPPCQGYSIMRNLPWLRDKAYPLLIAPTRELLVASGLPYVIENVAGARYRATLPEGLKAGWLCGQMFGLPILRHRYFETNFFWLQPGHGRHQGTVLNGRQLGARARDMVTIMPSMTGGLERRFRENGARKTAVNIGHAAGFALAKAAMEIDWMTRDELSQAIPPRMTEYIGRFLRAEIDPLVGYGK